MVDESVDLRVWSPDLVSWTPIQNVVDARFQRRGDMEIDKGEVTVGTGEQDILWQNVATRPIPVTMTFRGEVWTGQVTNAKKNATQTSGQWQLFISSDDKHLHRMLAQDPDTAADEQGPGLVYKGTLGAAVTDFVTSGAARTGLPVYLIVETDGPDIEVEARPEDTVASLLQEYVDRSDVWAEVRVRLPGEPLPGEGPVLAMGGVRETSELHRTFTDSWWSRGDGGSDSRVSVDPRTQLYPALYDYGMGAMDIVGRSLPEERKGIAWQVFADPDYSDGMGGAAAVAAEAGEEPGEGDEAEESSEEPVDYGRTAHRVADNADLVAHLRDSRFRYFRQFVSEYPPGTWGKSEGELAAARKAVERGKVLRLKHGELEPFTMFDLNSLHPLDHLFVWRSGQMIVIASRLDFLEESAKRESDLRVMERGVPGIMVWIRPTRDRREVVFSTAPGGGIAEYETTHSAPEAAELIAGTKWDQWVVNQIKAGEDSRLSPEARAGERGTYTLGELEGRGSPAVGAATRRGEGFEHMDIDVRRHNTLTDSSTAYSRVAATINPRYAGPFYYREKYASVGSGAWSADTANQLEHQWADIQGSITLSITSAPSLYQPFGRDEIVDGVRRFGWRIGDRVTITDRGAQLSEVISGWELTFSADQPTMITPLFGRRFDAMTPIDRLVTRVREVQRQAEKDAVAPSVSMSNEELAEIVSKQTGASIEEIRARLAALESGTSEEEGN
ncbi:hypothetical protein [Corynebacterium sp. TAE3-ERU16]|uniref:hypothetical protein n=1 Tax=Corynebacterium sp. TAE3-ERU16 TaxID=2849493 RepID=UPI001C453329|nr:hypothetical protein [Corynebacterium sp. TAE3-ERU16]MBV7292384.1 hypothetical protein [Corynebacterium sp. TAE3-ERU16]